MSDLGECSQPVGESNLFRQLPVGVNVQRNDAGTVTLAELEAVIERGLESFIEVGKALMVIRDSRLYRACGFQTFEEYCQHRWGWKRAHAYRQIEAARVAVNLSPMGDNLPRNERQARELAVLEPEQQREVASRIDLRTVTAAAVRQEVEKTRLGVHFSSDSDEWRTPPEVLSKVVDVLAVIDLDPCADAERLVPATTHFTREDNAWPSLGRGRFT